MKNLTIKKSLFLVVALLASNSLFAQNTAPTFTSTAVTSVDDGASYRYFIQTNDMDGDAVTVTAPTKPSWLTLTAIDLTTIGEGSAGGADGDQATAEFSAPTGIVVDGAGNMYVSQNGHNQHKIRKITPDGIVSTLAGAGPSGSANGTGSGASFGNPFGLFIDASDNIYVADNADIRKITSAGVVTTIGTTSQPVDVVVDSDGKVYSIEYNLGVINRFPAGGGSPTTFSTVNGGGQIGGMVIDASNNIYVGTRGADIGTGKIYKVTPDGNTVTEEVTDLNLRGGLAMDGDGNFYYTTYGNEVHKVTMPGATVSTVLTGLNGSWEVAVDASGNIYAPSTNGNQIKTTLKGYKLSGDATDKVGDHNVTLTANDGNGGTVDQGFTITVNDITPPSFENSTPSAASITGTGLTLNTDIDEGGTIYYVVLADGAAAPTAAEVKAGTGSSGATAAASGSATVSTGEFTHAFSITELSSATAYDLYVVAEDDEGTPNLASPAKIDVSTANTPPSFTSAAVTTVKLGSEYSYDISATDADGHGLTYTAPTVPSWLSFNAAGVSTLAGSTTSGMADGTGTDAQFNQPAGIARGNSGNIYVAEWTNHTIRKVTPEGVVTTLAGSHGTAGFADGTGTAARFNTPAGIAVDASENVYVTEFSGHRIRKITSEGVVTTIAGNGTGGFADDTGTAAQFNGPIGITIDESGNLYVGDFNNHRIRKITAEGVVTTLAGSGIAGFADGTGAAAQFSSPTGVVVDASGNLYMGEFSGHRIRKITAEGVVTTLAGSGISGFADGTGTAAQFNSPFSITLDQSDNVLVGGNGFRLRKISPAGVVSTVVGNGSSGSVNGTLSEARLGQIWGVAIDDQGKIFLGGHTNHTIRTVSTSNKLSGTPTADHIGTHNLVLEVSDGNGGTVQQSFTIEVLENTPPAFTSATTASFAENGTGTAYTAVATDANTITYSLGSGNDEALFNINSSTGAVTFKAAPDFETPGDTDDNNTYVINVIATDEAENASNQDVTITVTDVDEVAPVLTSATSANFAENGTGTAYTVVATDANSLTYSFGSGNDEALFDVVSSSGVVTFKSAPDFESPTDSDKNNTYVFNVVATDDAGNAANQDVTITVTDEDDTVLGIATGEFNHLSIYPNPVTEENFTIQFDQALSGMISVLNMEGRMIKKVSFKGKKAQLNLSGELPGVYLIKVTSAEGTQQTKLFRQ
ncbi:MAG: T9SS type A sorting domain-containing protein [Reichenbachiella sp.]|uniref:T9SS type A sorting domain-containing protein n=2 Tax=Reichenbachiella sp. TaxID=2184521 RepID=UPI003297F6D0